MEHEEDIQFMIVKECPKEDLNYWEEHYIKLFQPIFNYVGVNVPFKKEKKEYSYNQNEFTF